LINQGMSFVAFPMPIRMALVLTFLALFILCMINFAVGISRDRAMAKQWSKEQVQKKNKVDNYEYNRGK